MRYIIMIWVIAITSQAYGTNILFNEGHVYYALKQDSLPIKSGPLHIPAVSGALTIDGRLDEPFWQSARMVSLANRRLSAFGEGGEVRSAVRGKFFVLAPGCRNLNGW